MLGTTPFVFLQHQLFGVDSRTCLLAAERDRCDNLFALGAAMTSTTILQIIEIVLVIVVIAIAIRFFFKRG